MDDPRQSRRQLARGERRRAGERSADLARALMKLGDAAIPKLEVGERLRAAIDRARRVTAPGARRRAERELAGTLRGEDMADLAARLERVKTTGAGDSRHLHVAERWRETMIAGGVAAAAGFPGGVDEELPQLIARAQGERATGKPPGAARALFRHLAAILKAQAAAERDEDEDDAGDDAEAEEGDEAAGDDAADEVAADDDDADDGDDADDADDAAS